MTEKKETTYYNFNIHNDDRTYKANLFIRSIDQLKNPSYELETSVKIEITNSSGELIKAIKERVTKQEEMNRTYHEVYKTVLKI